jgi:hypothetical protein
MKTLFLDLDETLINTRWCSLSEAAAIAEKFGVRFVVDREAGRRNGKPQIIFERPSLPEFLAYVFRHFSVGVYTAATKDYAGLVINSFFTKTPKYIFTREHLHLDALSSGPKDLMALVRAEVGEGKMAQRSVFLIDDNEDVFSHQRQNVIVARAYSATPTKCGDEFLNHLLTGMALGLLRFPTDNFNAFLSAQSA